MAVGNSITANVGVKLECVASVTKAMSWVQCKPMYSTESDVYMCTLILTKWQPSKGVFIIWGI